MRIPNRTSWLIVPFFLSACFGKVKYGDDLEEPVRGAPWQDSGLGGSEETGVGGAHASGARDSLGVGGAGLRRRRRGRLDASGGSDGGPTAPPRLIEPEPICQKDCCPQKLTQITHSFDGGSLDSGIDRAYIAGEGRWVVFTSAATNLVAADLNGQREVFSYDLGSFEVKHLSVRGDGELGDGPSDVNAVSDDGQWVVFTSSASNFSLADENEVNDVFLLDQTTSEIVRVSSGPAGQAANGSSWGRDISADGRFVVYSSGASNLTVGDDNDAWDVFVWDRTTGQTERVSMGPGDQQTNPISGEHAHISADGRYVSFHSSSDLLGGDDENGAFDAFVMDRQTGMTQRISESLVGEEPNGSTFVLGMSDDARFFATYSGASDLVVSDTNDRNDVFLIDRQQGLTTRVSVGPMGQEADAGSSSSLLSRDGRFVTFSSRASNLAAIAHENVQNSFMYDGQTGKLRNLSQNEAGVSANRNAQAAQVSLGAKCFVFASSATNLSDNSSLDDVVDLYVGPLPSD